MRRFEKRPLSWAKVNGNLRVHPGDEEELKRLARSYKKRPVHPLIVRPDGMMLDGTRRVLGLRLIGETEAEFLITDEDLRPEGILEIQLVTAIHRAGLTGYEKWQGCLRLMQLHPEWQQVDLANFLSLTPASVTYMLSPSKCLPAIQEALKAERITLADCYTMSKVSDAEQHDMLAAKLNGAKPEELRRQARRARSGTNGQAVVKTARVRIALPGDISIVISGRELGMAEVVELLAETLKEARRAAEQYDVKTFQSMMRDKANTGS
ncbi:MAG TPA: ParB/RepB/Spo0J family partition protein [Gemmataceae bacterium]|nr:ParB/RepB/Spo0J family partition protein [Gemmataceae bacterium]